MTRKHWTWLAIAIAVFLIWRYKGTAIKTAITNTVKKVK